MKNKDIHEWLLDEEIDSLTTIKNNRGEEVFLCDILEKHLIEQLRLCDINRQLSNNEAIMIKCPSCNTVQAAICKHTIPFYTYIHYCKNCNYVIMESEWDIIEPFQQG